MRSINVNIELKILEKSEAEEPSELTKGIQLIKIWQACNNDSIALHCKGPTFYSWKVVALNIDALIDGSINSRL